VLRDTFFVKDAEQGRPPASVVIRNRNERANLERLLRVLNLQTVRPEIIVVDNESTDGSAEAAAACGAKVVHLAKSAFTYGHAINVGVSHGAAEIIILLSSHSLPLGSRFIEDCLKPFADPKMGAVRCLRLERAAEWLDPVVLEGPITWDIRVTLLPENNGCAFRKAVWQEFPFNEQLESCEDYLWCYQALHAGYRIGTACAWYQYVPTARFWESLRRHQRSQVSFYRISKRRTPLVRILRDILYVAPRTAVSAALRVIFGSIITAMAPWHARRPPRSGSLR
jgi:rhamnosyltransferase